MGYMDNLEAVEVVNYVQVVLVVVVDVVVAVDMVVVVVDMDNLDELHMVIVVHYKEELNVPDLDLYDLYLMELEIYCLYFHSYLVMVNIAIYYNKNIK